MDAIETMGRTITQELQRALASGNLLYLLLMAAGVPVAIAVALALVRSLFARSS
jgi:hypothetical protein